MTELCGVRACADDRKFGRREELLSIGVGDHCACLDISPELGQLAGFRKGAQAAGYSIHTVWEVDGEMAEGRC